LSGNLKDLIRVGENAIEAGTHSGTAMQGKLAEILQKPIDQVPVINDPGQFLETSKEALSTLENLDPVNFNFLGINLADVPEFIWPIALIPLVSAFMSFLSAHLTQKFSKRAPMPGMGGMMIYLLGPGISLWLGFTLPAALGVYWIGQNALQIPQEYFLTKHFNKVLDEEEARKAAHAERAKAAEAAQKEEDRQRRAERIAAQQNKKHKPKRYKLKNTPPEPKKDQEENEG
jgi:YidC/Oxa1 family membrane protein insertase